MHVWKSNFDFQLPGEVTIFSKTQHTLVVQSFSCVWLFVTPWTAALQASLSFPLSQSFLTFISIESMMPSNRLIPSPSSPPSLNLSQISVFSSESVLCIRWLKHWSFSFSISPSNEYSGLISCWIDWFEVLAVQGTLRSLLQHHRYINFLKSWHLLCPLSAQKFSLSPHCLHVKI